jgi:hypothetical protein
MKKSITRRDFLALSAAAPWLDLQAWADTGQWTVERPLSINDEPVKLGVNAHNWGTGLAPKFTQLGCKSIHMVTGAGNFTGTWPGPHPHMQVCDSMIRESAAAGIETVLTLIGYSEHERWPKFVTAVVTGLKGVCEKFVFDNEPKVSQVSRTYDGMKATYPILKAANPRALLLGPATTGDAGNGFAFVRKFMALNPWPYLDGWAWHTYYDTPEGSYLTNTSAMSRMVQEAAGKPVPMFIEEVGWNEDPREAPAQAPAPKVADYYSRYPFLAAATPNLRTCNFYEAIDEPPTAFGLYKPGWVEKPAAASFRDAAAHIHASNRFACYARGTPADKQSGRWFVRLDAADGGQRLAAWHPTATFTERLWAVADKAVNLNVQSIGSGKPVDAIPLTAGPQQISVPLSTRAVVLQGSGVRFPEFS